MCSLIRLFLLCFNTVLLIHPSSDLLYFCMFLSSDFFLLKKHIILYIAWLLLLFNFFLLAVFNPLSSPLSIYISFFCFLSLSPYLYNVCLYISFFLFFFSLFPLSLFSTFTTSFLFLLFRRIWYTPIFYLVSFASLPFCTWIFLRLCCFVCLFVSVCTLACLFVRSLFSCWFASLAQPSSQ